MQCISINYKHADVSIRERVHISAEALPSVLRALCGHEGASCVLLCTCNRTEVYFCGIPEDAVCDVLSRESGMPVQALLPHLRLYAGEKAMLHLFRVAGGLHSMVLGEDEILRQTKEAYRLACENGCVGYELHQCFQAAITCAKRIRTETPLSATPVSVATLAANEAVRCGSRVLVIGATGQIGTAVVKNILAHKGMEVTATLRTHGKPLAIAADRVCTADYADRYRLIADADCVISATASPHFTVTLHGLRQSAPERPLLFIDLAVPPDIDPSVTELPDVRRLGIDDFAALAQENQSVRAGSAETAERIIAEETETLRKALLFHDFQPAMGAVCEKLRSAPERMLYRLRDTLDADALAALLHALEE